MPKLTFPRDWYVPKGATKIADKQSDAVAYVYETKGVLYGLAFAGKACKPAWHYRFRASADREKRIAEFFEGRRKSLAFKAEQHQKRKAEGRGLEVGDVLRNSWGYDQTNIDYYEVTALIGRNMVEIRPIGAESVDTAWAQGKSAPIPGKYIGAPMRKVAKNGAVKIHSWGSYARKMEPTVVAGVRLYEASHWTAYA